ncbi:hypothetical protein M3650_06540 [Paenibacillus sp. MER TA 81-3]|nr:hypothetical protein [Paenibacillus sp. MER TA 81-3]
MRQKYSLTDLLLILFPYTSLIMTVETRSIGMSGEGINQWLLIMERLAQAG